MSPSHSGGQGIDPIAQAMISTSCSSNSASNQSSCSGVHPAPCASKKPPIIRSASFVPRCQARNFRRFKRVA
ncbi:hypothetical protein WR25_01630 [Diploscapter pachys]|uniref:Uncharacterized protein n=1 Tax=Diploscapter pachys TaxID=2018661 RepID=A0A2A2K5A2_9BILA|nr:hypothetical protein WR25_01630 [Diploscapter pachys]